MRIGSRKPTGERLERMRASPLWDGKGFRNQHPILPGLRDHKRMMPSMSEFLSGRKLSVPGKPLPAMNPLVHWTKPAVSGLRATWLGHSTVLLEMDGIRILTDPVWGLRASPSSFIGPKRFQPVPAALDALPRIDLVVISHDHYDHLDFPTIRQLAKRDVAFVTPLGVGAHLEAWGIQPQRIVELDWWQSHAVPNTDLVVTATPSQHFSGRGLTDRNATLWSSFVLRSPSASVFFSGDTGLTTEYQSIGELFGPFDLVMLEVGAFHPAWGHMHLGPENALKALQLLGGGALLPIHWGTFSLAPHAWDQPIEFLLNAIAPLNSRLLLPRLGEPVEPALWYFSDAWWRGIHDAETDSVAIKRRLGGSHE